MNADWQLKFNLQTEIKTDCDWGSVSGHGAGRSRSCGWVCVWVGVRVSGRSDKSETSTKQTQRQTSEHKHKWIKPNRSILCSANKALHTLSDCLLFYAWHSNCRPYDWLMISLALLFHFKTRAGTTQIETLPKACTAHCPPPSPAFATARAWHLPLPRANQSFSSSAAHCAQHSSHTVPRLLVVVVAVPFCLVSVVAVVFALANQSSLSATTSSAQKRKKKQWKFQSKIW